MQIKGYIPPVFPTLTLLLAALIAFPARGCERDDHQEAVKAYQESERDRLENLRLHRVAAGLEKGPESEYFEKLRAVLEAPGFRQAYPEADIRTVRKALVSLKETPKGVYALFIDPEAPVAKALDAVMKDKAHRYVSAQWTEAMGLLASGKGEIPSKLTKPGNSPEPFEYWSWPYWFVFWTIASLVAVVAYVLIIGEFFYDRDPFEDYPWKKVGGVAALLLAAPVTVPVFVVYGIYRLALLDWSEALSRKAAALKRAGYRLHLFRKLPPPAFETVAGIELPELEDVPAPVDPRAAVNDELTVIRRRLDPAVQWYAFRPSLVEGQVHALTRAGVKLVPIEIEHPERYALHAVHASQARLFEEVLGLQNAPMQTDETDIQATVFCTYETEIGAVTAVTAAPEHHPVVIRILERLSARFSGIDLDFDADRDLLPVAPMRTSGVNIWHCCRPAEEMTTVTVNRFCGQDFPDGWKLILPAEGRGAVLRDADGNAAIQVIGRNVFTLSYHLLTENSAWSIEILSMLLASGIQSALSSPPMTEPARSREWRDQLASHRHEYISMALQRYERHEEDLRARIQERERDITSAGRTIAKAVRERRQLERELERFLNGEKGEIIDRLGKEFDRLAASPNVISIRCRGGSVDVFTRLISIRYRGEDYPIGRFMLRLGDDGSVSIMNIENRAVGTDWQHPHVRSSGSICFGDVQEAVSKHLGDRRFSVVTDLIVRFLEQYNPHHGVEDIAHWKERSHAKTA